MVSGFLYDRGVCDAACTVMRKISEFYLQERIGIGYTHQMRSKKATSPT